MENYGEKQIIKLLSVYEAIIKKHQPAMVASFIGLNEEQTQLLQ